MTMTDFDWTAIIQKLCSPEWAIIEQLFPYQPLPIEPDFAHVHAFYRARDLGGQLFAAGGTSTNMQVAIVKATAEAVERFCASAIDGLPYIYASYAEIVNEAVDPQQWIQFAPTQYTVPGFPFHQITKDDPIGWMRGVSLTSGSPVYVPASIVDQTYRPHSPAERFEVAPLSGYACGSSLDQALLHGLLEVVERDAFMVSWYTQRPLVGIDLRTTPGNVQTLLQRYATCPARIFCWDLTSDLGIPTALVGLLGQSPELPALVVAMATKTDMAQAIERALEELAANLVLVRSLWLQRWRQPLTLHQVQQAEDHGLFYATQQNLRYLAPWLRTPNLQPFSAESSIPSQSLSLSMADCVERLRSAGLEAYYVDLTLPQVRDLGLYVVKVLIPQAQPIDFGWSTNHWGGKRLKTLPQVLAYISPGLNPYPHPFP